MKTAFLLVALLLSGTSVRATDMTAAGETFTDFYIQAGHLKHTYRRVSTVEKKDIKNGVVHADLRRGEHRYLLVAYTEPSRPQNPMAKCGGGVESYLVWIEFIGGTICVVQSVHYESCWQSIEGNKPVWAKTRCSVRYEQTDHTTDGKDEAIITRSVASFDSLAPEKGLEIVDQPPEKQKP